MTLWQAYLRSDGELVATLLAAISVEDAIQQARNGRPLAALLKLWHAIDAVNADLCTELSREVTVSAYFNEDLGELTPDSPSSVRRRLLESVNQAAGRAAEAAARAAAEARANDEAAGRAAADAARAAAEARANDEAAGRAAAEAARARFVEDQVWTRGLPQLVMSGGAGTPSVSSHVPVDPRVGAFSEIAGDIVWRDDYVSAVYHELNGSESLSYSNESGIAAFVRATLRDIVNGHPQLRGVVEIDTEVTVASLRPDIMVFSINRLPIGYCEVKKPGLLRSEDAPLNRGDILGQAYDYAMELRHLHGLQWAFVILTTFAHWRVLWLDDAAGNYGAELAALDDESVAAPRATVDAPGAICGGIVRGIGRPQVASFLASVLLKMAKSPRNASGPVCRPLLQPRGMQWQRYAEPQDSSYSFPADPRPPFVRLEQLLSGRDGSCWIVAKGNQKYVLKIVRKAATATDDDARNAALREASRWECIWGVSSQAVMVLGRHALVMPYVEIFPDAASYMARVRDVEVAVAEMADKGFVHGDLFDCDGTVKYWHFGLLRGRVVAIDLQAMTRMDPAAATADVRGQIASGRFGNAAERHLGIHGARG